MVDQLRCFIRRGSGSPKPLLVGGRLGSGALGDVYALLGPGRGYAVKIYKGDPQRGISSQSIANANESKVDWLIRIGLPLAQNVHRGKDYPQLAWPADKVYDEKGRFCGFTMPEIDLSNAADLSELMMELDREAANVPNHFHFRLHTARNLAFLFHHLHASGVCMIDLKPDNIKFYRDAGFVCLIDCDSFISSDRSQPHDGAFFTELYMLPEAAANGVDAAEYREEQDRFALAVVIFQMFNEGIHPFDGLHVNPANAASGSDIQKQIDAGLYPCGLVPHPDFSPRPQSRHEWFDDATRRLFDRAFGPGGLRPSAKEWAEHLGGYLDANSTKLLICKKRPDKHVHFDKGCFLCAWDDYKAKVRAKQKADWPRPGGVPANRPKVQQAAWVPPKGAPVKQPPTAAKPTQPPPISPTSRLPRAVIPRRALAAAALLLCIVGIVAYQIYKTSPSTLQQAASRTGSNQDKRLLGLNDKFEGSGLGNLSSTWQAFGNRVLLGDPPGWVSIRTLETDTYPRIESRGLRESDLVVVSLRHRMIDSNTHPDHFFPSIGFKFSSGEALGFAWLRSSYAPDYCSIDGGFDRVMARVPGGACVISKIRSSSLYGLIVESEIVVNTLEGTFTYDLGNDGKLDFSGKFAAGVHGNITGIVISGYGWHTGHRHDIDEISVWHRNLNSEPAVTQVAEWVARVALGKEINVRAGPGINYPVTSTEAGGSVIVTTGLANDTEGRAWQQVRLSNGRRGFIASWVAEKSLFIDTNTAVIVSAESVEPVDDVARVDTEESPSAHPPPAREIDLVRSQTEWHGQCSQKGYKPYPMIMYVNERNGSEINGVLHWPTLRNSKTRFKGKIEDKHLTFTEYELIAGGGIAMPNLYEGEIIGNRIYGTWRYRRQTGTFQIAFAEGANAASNAAASGNGGLEPSAPRYRTNERAAASSRRTSSQQVGSWGRQSTRPSSGRDGRGSWSSQRPSAQEHAPEVPGNDGSMDVDSESAAGSLQDAGKSRPARYIGADGCMYEADGRLVIGYKRTCDTKRD
jgi:hypothetical protein